MLSAPPFCILKKAGHKKMRRSANIFTARAVYWVKAKRRGARVVPRREERRRQMISAEQFESESTALFPAFHRLGMSILFNVQDAQDAMQQALLKAWEARGRIRPDTFRPFLTRIFINECRNIQRGRRRVTPVADIDPGGEAYIPEDTGLMAAINALPEKLRTPLLLCCMENYRDREAAKALGISHTALRNRLYRARRALFAALSEKEEAQG